MKTVFLMKPKARWHMLVGLLCACLLSAGCSHLRFPAAFKIDVAQGNILEGDKVEQLQPGMTQRQVVYLLGSPVMRDPFQPQVWNYVYQFSHGGKAPHFYRLELRFEGDVLRTIKGDINQIKPWHKTDIRA
jgi:outer membrane protein assembly factor BamE